MTSQNRHWKRTLLKRFSSRVPSRPALAIGVLLLLIFPFQNCGKYSRFSNSNSSVSGLIELSTSHSNVLSGNPTNSGGTTNSGTPTNTNTPTTTTKVNAPTVFSAGHAATCVVVSGELQCWGDNSNGKLGSGQNLTDGTHVSLFDSGVSDVSLNKTEDGGCAVVNGSVRCWGDSYISGTGYSQFLPHVVINSGATAVSVGSSHACAIVNGSLLCWGYDLFGQLGPGATASSKTPVEVFKTDVTEVSAGGNHTCAIVSGSLYCWGDNHLGQVGSSLGFSYAIPQMIFESGVTKVSAGTYHTCAIVNGNLYCWGHNLYGQIGNSSSTQVSSATNKVLGPNVKNVSAGTTFTCAVMNEDIYCWGDNAYYQSSSLEPLTINSPTKLALLGTKSLLTTGEYHACALTSIGSYCWGLNTGHQIDATSKTPLKSTAVGIVNPDLTRATLIHTQLPEWDDLHVKSPEPFSAKLNTCVTITGQFLSNTTTQDPVQTPFPIKLFVSIPTYLNADKIIYADSQCTTAAPFDSVNQSYNVYADAGSTTYQFFYKSKASGPVFESVIFPIINGSANSKFRRNLESFTVTLGP